ncbi:hypothetical protein FRX31_027926 [Thalictrum thalictroides]|uniref:Uncharacterized protein n=1 Tax=Thalictrum thalictroides TaxID=46969 RepID=A0A7J6VCL3_THATH|nr:hypothetical protein FRX31_027926 [Thalictrum thalictroides]
MHNEAVVPLVEIVPFVEMKGVRHGPLFSTRTQAALQKQERAVVIITITSYLRHMALGQLGDTPGLSNAYSNFKGIGDRATRSKLKCYSYTSPNFFNVFSKDSANTALPLCLSCPCQRRWWGLNGVGHYRKNMIWMLP